MPSSDHIKALIRSHAEGDSTRFYSVAMQLAASEARHGHGKLAQELRELIDRYTTKLPSDTASGGPIPIAQPSKELADLLGISQPKVRLADMILPDAVLRRIRRILSEQHHLTKIKSHGLAPRQRFLLVGPPGCGKTYTASVLAGELGLPLLVVRLEALMTKYMGETAAKLRLIFDAIENTRAVYLFDEFDSIGVQRGSANDVGEMRRVLNSFLTFIEHHRGTSLIIAATNHPESLDYALFRRFDDIIQYDLPNRVLLIRLLRAKLSSYRGNKISFARIAREAIGSSYADISRVCDDAAKEMIINGRRTLTTPDVLRALSERMSLRVASKAGTN